MNRRTFLTALAGLPLVGRLAPTVPQGIIPTEYIGEVIIPRHNVATGVQVYFAPADTPFPPLGQQPNERWTLLKVGESSAQETSGGR